MTGASAAELGAGTTLSDGSYSIAALHTIGKCGASRADLDVTAHDSSDNALAFIAGLVDGGTLTCSGYLKTSDTSGQMQAITDMLAGTHKTYTLTLPNTDASTLVFYGHCNKYTIDPSLKGAIGIDLSFRISGKPVFTV